MYKLPNILILTTLTSIIFLHCNPNNVVPPSPKPNLTFKANGIEYYEFVPDFTTIDIDHSSKWKEIVSLFPPFAKRYEISAFIKTDKVPKRFASFYLTLYLNNPSDTLQLNKVYQCEDLNGALESPWFELPGDDAYGYIKEDTECEFVVTYFDGRKMSGNFMFKNIYNKLEFDPNKLKKIDIVDGKFIEIEKDE